MHILIEAKRGGCWFGVCCFQLGMVVLLDETVRFAAVRFSFALHREKINYENFRTPGKHRLLLSTRCGRLMRRLWKLLLPVSPLPYTGKRENCA
eukprot:6478088-Amphidinium_carterae.1